MTYREMYEAGRHALADAGISEASLDARLLLEYVCDTDRNTLLVHGERVVTEAEEARYLDCISTRSKRVPLQHITGVQEFMGLKFAVNEKVLIPRQDTEILVEEALKELHDGMSVMDMCTGSGCILISLLHYTNNCRGLGVDLSTDALTVARENAISLLGEATVAETLPEEDGSRHIAFVHSDLYDSVDGMFDVIVSNPPYIPTEVIAGLMPEVRDFEPMMALDGEADGLTFYRKIIAGSRQYLKKGGALLFEIGFDQGEDVKRLMEEAGYKEVSVVKDYAGLDRVVKGTLGFEG